MLAEIFFLRLEATARATKEARYQLQLAVCTDHVANRQGILVFLGVLIHFPPICSRHIERPAGCPRPGFSVASFSIPAKAGKVPMPKGRDDIGDRRCAERGEVSGLVPR